MTAIALRTRDDVRALRARSDSLPSVREKIAKRAAEEFTRMAREDFDAKRAPDGKPWEAGRHGGTPAKHKTGALEAEATKYEAVGPRIRVSVSRVRYARYQRPGDFIPRELPARYLARLREIATEETTKHLEGRS